MRIVHYVNQFFGGLGGEDRADEAPRCISGAVPLGRALEGAVGPEAQVVATIVAGDNFAVEQRESLETMVLREVEALRPDVVVAGPAFAAGRYGLACGAVIAAVSSHLRIPGLTGMSADNPGVDEWRGRVLIARTGGTAASMNDALQVMARLARKLARGEGLAPAAVDGYYPSGVRRNVLTGVSAARRATELALARVRGSALDTELALPPLSPVAPPPPLPSLGDAVIALVSEGGVVVRGNPAGLPRTNAQRWVEYSVAGKEALSSDEMEVVHGGVIATWTEADPNRNVPLDAVRALEGQKGIGRVLDRCYITMGNGGNVGTMHRLGAEIAAELSSHHVSGVLLTAT